MSQAGPLHGGGGGGGGSTVETLTGNDGTAVSPIGNNINLIGVNGVFVTGNNLTATLDFNVVGGGFNWNVVTSATNPNQIVSQNGYICSGSSLVIFDLPLTASIGDTFKIFSFTSKFQIIPNGSQQLIVGTVTGLAGSTGTCTSNSAGDMVTFTYMGGNVFQSESPQGTLTIVIS